MYLEDLNKTPFFFIIGRPRSGTTLLSTLFDAHPNVKIPFESPVILYLKTKYSKNNIWDKHLKQSFLNDLMRIRKIDRWGLNQQQLSEYLFSLPENISFESMIKAVYYQFPSFFPKNQILLFGDKNPVYSLYFKKIFNLFPDARYIHLIRDYRDNILSVKKLDFEAPLTSIIAYRWKFANNIIYRLSQKYPDKFYRIRYEDLISSPEKELPDICNFLGINYDSSVLNFHLTIENRLKKYTENEIRQFKRFHSNLLKPVNTSKSGIWKTEMKEKDIKTAESVAGKWAEKFGYQRKFTKINIYYLISSLPAIVYVRITYGLYNFISLLPHGIQKIIGQNGPVFARILTKIAKKQ